MKHKLLYIICIAIGSCNISLRAQDGSEFSGGSGQQNDPWLIEEAKQLAALNNYLGPSNADKYFKIIKSINLEEWLSQDRGNNEPTEGWYPLGGSESFRGHLNGSGNTISGLWINRKIKNVGLFGYAGVGSSIQNLTVEITNSGVIGGDNYVGGLVGMSSSSLKHCHVRGGGMISGGESVGGLVGADYGSVSFCSSTVEVSGNNYLGGMIGSFYGNQVSQSYATGKVTSKEGSKESHVGGLIGKLDGQGGKISQCYATGDVSIAKDAMPGPPRGVGGLIGLQKGKHTFTECYATGTLKEVEEFPLHTGGLVGYPYGEGTKLSFDNCFYRDGMSDENPIYGKYRDVDLIIDGIESVYCKSETELKNKQTFEKWDFETIWKIDGQFNNGYPSLIPYHVLELTEQTGMKYSNLSSNDLNIIDEGNFSFKIDLDNGYEQSTPVVSIKRGSGNPAPVYPDASGLYTIQNITSYTTVTVEGIEFTSPNNYHTVALDLAPGIDLYNLASGELTVKEGGYLHLQFLPEDRTLTADDILFLIDGVETPFKDFGGSYYFSYILNPIEKDYRIVIALKKYPVSFPEIEGLTFTSLQDKANYGKPFTFAVSSETLDLSEMKVYDDNGELTPDALRADSYTYTIDAVTGPVTITVEGVNTTGNVAVAEDKVNITVENGQLKVESAETIEVTVYTIRGQQAASRRVNGQETIALSPGIYLVKTPEKVAKVVIP